MTSYFSLCSTVGVLITLLAMAASFAVISGYSEPGGEELVEVKEEATKVTEGEEEILANPFPDEEAVNLRKSACMPSACCMHVHDKTWHRLHVK